MDLPKIRNYLKESKLGFIGAGKMAQAIAKGLVKQELISPADIHASAPSNTNLKIWEDQGMNTTLQNENVLKICRTVFIAVKPQYLRDAFSEILTLNDVTDVLFVSVVAGVSSAYLEEIVSKVVPSSRVVRVMPNTPLLLGVGCSVFCGGVTSNENDIILVKSMLSDLGMCIEVKESMMDAVGAISGCGPAFMYLIIEAIADGGVRMGVPRDIAQRLASQTMVGAAQMVLQTGQHPGQLKDEVCSPGGSTIAGVQALENRAVRAAMIAAIEASTIRSLELGKKK